MDYIFSAASLFSIYTSLTAIVTLFGQFYSRFVPQQLHDYIASKLEGWFKNPFPKDSFTLVINQLDGDHNAYNLLYKACEAYISDRLRASATRLNGSYMNLEEPVSYQIAQGEEFVETLENAEIKLLWKSVSRGTKGQEDHFGHNKSFELSFNLAYKNEVLDVHIPLVVVKYYNDMTAAKRNLTLFTYMARSSQWRPVPFNHPFIFDTLAIDPALKQAVLDDLDKFIRRKDFYKKVGKAWKRGYLLYGPPGTGKSSLIAAMANYLRFDIYDLQLGGLQNDAILRTLMLSTKNKSILVIEDIDCTIGFSRTQSKDSTIGPPRLSRRNFGFDMNDLDFDGCKVTPDIYYQANEETAKVNMKADTKLSLSGLLNFIDGLWSSCGDERIVVFTTNHKDSLDPALLRPGRMDMHIHMSYLRMHGFRILVNNYLGVAGEHFLFKEIEQLLDIANVTPAQVAEELIRSEDADIALSGVVDMLKKSLKQSRKKKVKAKNNKVVMKANKDHSVSQGDSKESGEQEDSENEEVEHSQKKEVKAKSNKAVKGNKDHSVSLGDSEESGEQEDSEDEEVDLGVHGQSTG